MTHLASIPNKVNERIVWARKRKGISQEKLAEIVGTSRRHMMRLEKGQHAPKEPMRQKLGEALDQDPDFFTLDEDDEESDPLAALSLDALLRLRIRAMLDEERERMTA